MNLFGTTRSSIQRNHALITPDTHVRSPLIGWHKSDAVIHISPALGARFWQYTAYMQPESKSDRLRPQIQRFVYVLQGTIELNSPQHKGSLSVGQYAYLPPGSDCEIRSTEGAVLEVFEKQYAPSLASKTELPSFITGDSINVKSEPFMGDEAAQLKTLLPKDAAFDMAVNLFTFQPGATLPLVEIHVMEHGLMLLEGMGVYRLDDRYYPITAGDVIWMASYCPQWWVAMGKTPSTYLYYKDVHRDQLEEWR